MIFSSWNASATALRALRGTGTPSRTWSTKYSSKDILKTSRVHTLGLALVWLERRCARALRHRKMKETKRIKTLRKWSIHWLIDLLVQIVDALCWWNVWDQQGFMKAAADSLNNYEECMAIKNNSELREVIHTNMWWIPSHLMRNAKVRPSKMTPWAAVKASRMAAASNFLVALGIDQSFHVFSNYLNVSKCYPLPGSSQVSDGDSVIHHHHFVLIMLSSESSESSAEELSGNWAGLWVDVSTWDPCFT